MHQYAKGCQSREPATIRLFYRSLSTYQSLFCRSLVIHLCLFCLTASWAKAQGHETCAVDTMYLHTYTHIHTCTKHTHTCIYKYIHTYINIYIFKYIYIYVYIIHKDTKGHEACAGVARLWSESRYIFTHILETKQNCEECTWLLKARQSSESAPSGHKVEMTMIAFITVKSSLVTLMEGLSSSNQCRFGFSVIRSYLIFFFFRSKNISKEKKQLVVNKMNQLLDLRLWLCCAMAASEASVLQVLVVPWPWWNRPGCRRYICHVICRVAHHWIVDCIFARCVRQGAWWVRRGSVAKWRGGRRARVGWLGRTAGHVTQKGVCSEYISSIFTIAWHMLWYWWKIRHVLYPLRLPMSVLLLTALRLILLPCIGEAKLVSSWRSVWRAKVAFGEVGLELFAMSSLTDENEVSEDALVRVPLGFDFLGLGRVCAQGGAASSRGSKRLVSKKRDTMSESKSQVRSPLSFLSCRNTYQNTCIWHIMSKHYCNHGWKISSYWSTHVYMEMQKYESTIPQLPCTTILK